tara:strand:+ start:671 stop:1357 length:687 start_codon:yes stop_codon:yes gene_type:complete
MSLRNIITEKQKNNNHFVWNNIEIFVKDQIVNQELSLGAVLDDLDGKLPKHFLDNIDAIYVGDFDFLKDRDIQAAYENSAIFVTNKQENVEDMSDDIVHEIAHSVEEAHRDQIYSDGELEREFILKRKQLYSVIKSENLKTDLSSFLEPSYDRNFDEYLYQEIGYPMLNMISSNIFYSPYAATSLREYFANGFEALYYFGDYTFIKNSCPVLFTKLGELMELAYDKEY